MTTEEAIRILTYHQEWRKGADVPQTDVKELTEAMDIAIEVMRNIHPTDTNVTNPDTTK